MNLGISRLLTLIQQVQIKIVQLMKEAIFGTINKERVHIVESLAEPVGILWMDLQKKYTQEGEFFMASPLSSTPIPIYQWVIAHAHEFPNWEKTRFVLMDEMLEGEKPSAAYIPTTDTASYEGFAYKHFLDPLFEKTGVRVKVVKPRIDQIASFETRIDLLLLAIGIQGNYANVMPNTPTETSWHIAHLIPEFRQSHTQQGSQSYQGAHFRDYGMSLGPQQVLAARNVVVIISGSGKVQLAEKLFSLHDVNTSFPLSIIHDQRIKNRVEFYLTKDVIE